MIARRVEVARALVTLMLACTAACGGSTDGARSSTDAGYASLGKGDARGAVAQFDAALAGLADTGKGHARAALGRCEALALIDGAAARQAFLDWAAKSPTEVREDDYGLVCSRLLQAEYRTDAMDVVQAGLDRFPESKRMAVTYEQVSAATKRANKPEELKKLETIGYVGGGK